MNDDETLERPLGVLIHTAINAAVATAFGVRLPWAIDSFREMLAAMGAEIGASTKLVMATKYIWLLFAVLAITLLVWVARTRRVTGAELRRMKFRVRGFTVVFGLTLAFTAWALYTPILKLGAPVE